MRHASGAKMYVMPSSAESAGHCSECNVALPLWHEAFLSFADTVTVNLNRYPPEKMSGVLCCHPQCKLFDVPLAVQAKRRSTPRVCFATVANERTKDQRCSARQAPTASPKSGNVFKFSRQALQNNHLACSAEINQHVR